MVQNKNPLYYPLFYIKIKIGALQSFVVPCAEKEKCVNGDELQKYLNDCDFLKDAF